jgi:hypothetical protein
MCIAPDVVAVPVGVHDDGDLVDASPLFLYEGEHKVLGGILVARVHHPYAVLPEEEEHVACPAGPHLLAYQVQVVLDLYAHTFTA